MGDHSGGHGKEKSPESADERKARSRVSNPGSRRRWEESEHAPIRLRYWDPNGDDGPLGGYGVLSFVVLELPLSELARLLPQRFAVKLYNLVRRLFESSGGPCFPCSLADLLRNRSLLTTMRSKLAHVNNLSELIADPPAILIDERQQLFFYRGFPVLLRPASFSYMLLLAQTPGEVVMREVIYRRLWPGEINFEGTNKPYERQITDQKRKLLDDIRKGITGRMEIREEEMDSLINTRHKRGYMLNMDRKNVVILRTGDLLAIVFLFLWALDRFISDWLLDLSEVLLLC